MITSPKAIARLPYLSAIALLLSLGLLLSLSLVVFVSSLIYALYCIVDLFFVYKTATSLRDRQEAQPPISFRERVESWIGQLIALAGLILFLVDSSFKTHIGISGIIIWGSAIIAYLLSGFILQEVGGIPLRMGYGGWDIRKKYTRWKR